MGVATNETKCKKCGEDFFVILEWKSKQAAMKELSDRKCPNCGSDDWYFTDEMGQ